MQSYHLHFLSLFHHQAGTESKTDLVEKLRQDRKAKLYLLTEEEVMLEEGDLAVTEMELRML